MGAASDYLVVGAGASAMAFVDSVFHAGDATFTLVDRRAAPGGHWNDAYPFVRLHQPASGYGVASRPLAGERIDVAGTNAGLYELATGVQVADHFHRLLDDVLLPSGRVRWLPMSEHVGGGEVRSLLSGDSQHVEARTLVDATLLTTAVPRTHRRTFAVAAGASCAPPNDLPLLAPQHRTFVVLGAGKTALDTVVWLVGHGADPDRITWVRPRDPWLINRASVQPGLELFEQTVALAAGQLEAIAAATSVADVARRVEAVGTWLRLDPDVEPTMFHAAGVTHAELELARRVRRVVRLGHVTEVADGELTLEGGTERTEPGALHIDCTARALERAVAPSTTPVFGPDGIALQMIRQFQPTFSAALVGQIEVTVDGLDERQAMTRPVRMTDTLDDYLDAFTVSMANEQRWRSHPGLAAWMAGCRLDLRRAFGMVPADDEVKVALLQRVRAAGPAAAANARRLLHDAAAAAAPVHA